MRERSATHWPRSRQSGTPTGADRLALGVAKYVEISNAWKSYALGYEVFCEATYEGDEPGVVNAGIVIAAARSKLQALGQYDA